MILFVYCCEFTALFSILLGLFVLLKGPIRRVNLLWSLVCISVGLYSIGQGRSVFASTITESLIWLTWTQYLGANLIPIFFFHFVILLLGLNRRRLLVLGYLLAAIFQTANFCHQLVVPRVSPPFNFYEYPLPAFWGFTVYFFGYVIYALRLLYDGMRRAEGATKNQLKYVFLGTAIGFFGGFTTFLLFVDISIFRYGIIAEPVYIFTVSYAIYKHHLLDINVVIRKTLLYSLISAALASVYVVTITLLAQILGGRHGPSSTASSAIAAILITLLFNPVRMKIQRFVDRHFFKESLDQAILREATSGFVHEIKRPLSNIAVPAELILMDLDDLKNNRKPLKDVLAKMEQRAQYILNQSMDAGHKIEAIREFSNSNGLPSENLGVSKIIRRSIAAEESLLRRHRINLKLDIGKKLPMIRGHAKQLEIVFSNLIKNAAEAFGKRDPAGQRSVFVKAIESNGHVVVSVKDSGPGIKRELLAHLFEPYFSTKGAKGMGIGLYLCRQLVQMQGGSIAVESGEGTGTTFVVQFPASHGVR